MAIETKIVESDYKLAQMGQWIGLTVVLATLALAGYAAYLGAVTAAVTIVGVDIVGLAAVFVYGSFFHKRAVREIHAENADALSQVDHTAHE